MKAKLAMAVLAVVLSGAALAGPPPALPLKGFTSDKSHDYFGYYLPASPVQKGSWSVRNLFVGGKDDLKSFESGKADKAFAGVMVELEDVTSPLKTGEDGNPYHSRQIRVLPTAYGVGNGRLRFTGTDKTLGAITFEGSFAADFFKKPTADVPHPDDHPILSGKLTIGGKVYNAKFNWFGGD